MHKSRMRFMNPNIYIVYGKKLMDYSHALLHQSSIELVSSAYDELDFLTRRLPESFDALFQIGQNEGINSTHLDLEELERNILGVFAGRLCFVFGMESGDMAKQQCDIHRIFSGSLRRPVRRNVRKGHGSPGCRRHRDYVCRCRRRCCR